MAAEASVAEQLVNDLFNRYPNREHVTGAYSPCDAIVSVLPADSSDSLISKKSAFQDVLQSLKLSGLCPLGTYQSLDEFSQPVSSQIQRASRTMLQALEVLGSMATASQMTLVFSTPRILTNNLDFQEEWTRFWDGFVFTGNNVLCWVDNNMTIPEPVDPTVVYVLSCPAHHVDVLMYAARFKSCVVCYPYHHTHLSLSRVFLTVQEEKRTFGCSKPRLVELLKFYVLLKKRWAHMVQRENWAKMFIHKIKDMGESMLDPVQTRVIMKNWAVEMNAAKQKKKDNDTAAAQAAQVASMWYGNDPAYVFPVPLPTTSAPTINYATNYPERYHEYPPISSSFIQPESSHNAHGPVSCDRPPSPSYRPTSPGANVEEQRPVSPMYTMPASPGYDPVHPEL